MGGLTIVIVVHGRKYVIVVPTTVLFPMIDVVVVSKFVPSS
jgi:hypothetical protein